MIPRNCTLLHPWLSLQLWLGELLVHQHPPPFQIHHRFPTFSSVKIIVNILHQIFTCRKTTLMGENPNNWGELLRSSLTGGKIRKCSVFSYLFHSSCFLRKEIVLWKVAVWEVLCRPFLGGFFRLIVLRIICWLFLRFSCLLGLGLFWWFLCKR